MAFLKFLLATILFLVPKSGYSEPNDSTSKLTEYFCNTSQSNIRKREYEAIISSTIYGLYSANGKIQISKMGSDFKIDPDPELKAIYIDFKSEKPVPFYFFGIDELAKLEGKTGKVFAEIKSVCKKSTPRLKEKYNPERGEDYPIGKPVCEIESTEWNLESKKIVVIKKFLQTEENVSDQFEISLEMDGKTLQLGTFLEPYVGHFFEFGADFGTMIVINFEKSKRATKVLRIKNGVAETIIDNECFEF